MRDRRGEGEGEREREAGRPLPPEFHETLDRVPRLRMQMLSLRRMPHECVSVLAVTYNEKK